MELQVTRFLGRITDSLKTVSGGIWTIITKIFMVGLLLEFTRALGVSITGGTIGSTAVGWTTQFTVTDPGVYDIVLKIGFRVMAGTGTLGRKMWLGVNAPSGGTPPTSADFQDAVPIDALLGWTASWRLALKKGDTISVAEDGGGAATDAGSWILTIVQRMSE